MCHPCSAESCAVCKVAACCCFCPVGVEHWAALSTCTGSCQYSAQPLRAACGKRLQLTPKHPQTCQDRCIMHSRLQSCSLVETASAVPFRYGKIGSMHLGVVSSSSYDWDESSDRDGAADPISVSTSVSQGTYGADDSLEVQRSIRTRVLTISHSESPRLSGSTTVHTGLSCFHQAVSAPTALLRGQRLETPVCVLGYATNSQQYAETRCMAVIMTCNELVARQ